MKNLFSKNNFTIWSFILLVVCFTCGFMFSHISDDYYEYNSNQRAIRNASLAFEQRVFSCVNTTGPSSMEYYEDAFEETSNLILSLSSCSFKTVNLNDKEYIDLLIFLMKIRSLLGSVIMYSSEIDSANSILDLVSDTLGFEHLLFTEKLIAAELPFAEINRLSNALDCYKI